MNAVLGTVQHQKAEKSLDSLKNLSAPCAKVIREGKKKEIPSRELVPGDLVELEAGDMVVADGRILDNFSLQGKCADRRIHQCRKDTRQSAGGSAAGRPQKHGIFRKPGHLWTRTGFGYRNRDAYRDRKDCRDDE